VENVSANISVPENITVIIPWISGANATASAAPVAAPEKVSACVFGDRSVVVEEIFSSGVPLEGRVVGVEVKWLGAAAKPMDLDDCALIVLSDKFLDFIQRTAVKEKVLNGIGLIVSGEGGTLVHGDPAVRGWDYVLGQVVPAVLPEEPANLTVNGTFVVIAKDPALEGIRDFNMSANLTDVYLGNGEAVALVRLGALPTSTAYYAVVRGRAGMGIVYYISFAPEAAPHVFAALSRFLVRNFLEQNFLARVS